MNTIIEDIMLLVDTEALYASPYLRASDITKKAYEILPPERRWISDWALFGQPRGHEWCVCDVCSEVKLMKPHVVKCSMTPKCAGNMGRIAARPRAIGKVKRNLGL